MNHETLQIKKLPHFRELPLPAYESVNAAGMDLRAALKEPVVLKKGERTLIPTGLQMAIPTGFEGQIRPRSGLAVKYGITMLNTPGTIDADYRGEVKLVAINHGEDDFTIEHGDRLAQMVLAPITKMPVMQVDHLPETKRAEGGFGSTGIK